MKTVVAALAAGLVAICAIAPVRAADHLWSRHLGGTDSDNVFDVATNAFGEVAVTGYFFGSIDLGGGALTSAGSADIFLAKYDVAGNHLWSRQLGDTGFDEGLGVCVDAAGAVIVTGGFQGTVDFGGGTLTSAGGLDVFLVKYDALGNHAWSRRFGGLGQDAAAEVNVDATGNLAFTGWIEGAVDFGGGAISGLGGAADIFLARIDAAGGHVWSRGFGGTDIDTGWNVAIDATGAVTLAGYFMGTLDLGGGPLTSAGDNDIYLARYDGSGTHVWSHRYGGTGDDKPAGLDVDSAGQPVLTATFVDTVDFGGGDLVSVNGADIALAKYDTNGNHMWSQRFGGIGSDKVHAVDVDASDHVVIAGGFPTTIDFGDGPHTSLGFDDIFIARFDGAGATVWSAQFSGTGDEKAYGVATDAFDNIVIAGTFETSVDFGGGTLTNPRSFDYDGFVARFSSPAPTGVLGSTPVAPVLSQNYPNPFNPITRISFSIQEASPVALRIYDTRGGLVRTLVDRTLEKGPKVAQWDGLNDSAMAVSSGVYFYRLDAGGYMLSRKMVLLK